MDDSRSNPSLRCSSSGAELNLRSQFLFLKPLREDAYDLPTAVAAWHNRFVHENGHWARFHGSTIGVLLTLLRRTRDSLSAHVITNQIDESDGMRFSLDRDIGTPLFSYEDPKPAGRLGGEIAGNRLDWLDLKISYETLFDKPGSPWDMKEAIERALSLTWFQSAGNAMLPFEMDPHISSEISGILTEHGPLTTRLLFECSSLIDEASQFSGTAFFDHVDESLWSTIRNSLSGPYGRAYFFANDLAGKQLSPNVICALIDFALNPPIPGLDQSVATGVRWAELYPPLRFSIAAKSLSQIATTFEDPLPSNEEVDRLYHGIERAAGIRLGKIDSILSTRSSLREMGLDEDHFTHLIPEISLFYAAKLNAVRKDSVTNLAHYGTNFNINVLQFIDPSREYPWWLFAPLRVSEGQYLWPSDHVNKEKASDFFLGAALSGALDDIVHRTGPLTSDYLPAFEDSTESEALNTILSRSTHMKAQWRSS